MKLPRPAVPASPRRVGPRRRPSVLLALLSVLVLALVPAPARADGGPAGRTASVPPLSFRESGCTEVAYLRGGLETAVRPLVPQRFTLEAFPGAGEGSAKRVYLLVNEVTCDRGEFPRRRGDEGPYTYLIVSASVTATEGDQRDGVYVLFFATESRTQRAALRRLGWPVTLLSRRTTAQVLRGADGVPDGSALHVVGGGWDHDLAALSSAPMPAPGASTAEYYRDTAYGAQSLCFANVASLTSAYYSGDLRGTPLAGVTYVPPVFSFYPGFLISGGWDATVTSGPCPATFRGARRLPDLRAGADRSIPTGVSGDPESADSTR